MDSETRAFGGGKRNGKGGYQARSGRPGGKGAGIDRREGPDGRTVGVIDG